MRHIYELDLLDESKIITGAAAAIVCVDRLATSGILSRVETGQQMRTIISLSFKKRR